MALGIALVIPVIRFGPRYFMLAREELSGVPHRWIDVVMDQDSQAAARILPMPMAIYSPKTLRTRFRLLLRLSV